MAEVALRMSKINKSFAGTKVVKDVDLDVQPGEVHALLGENGAGKSVLMKTLMGVHQPDSGEYFVGPKRVRFVSPAEAQRNGVSMVYQEFGLIESLSVTENILMGRLPSRRGLVDWGMAHQQCKEVLGRLHSNVCPTAAVGDLKVADRQEVEIARALSYEPVVLVMDEPTSALGHAEVRHLYSLIDILRNRGVAIVYITHKLEEVFDLADRVTVIRDGAIVATYPTEELTVSRLIETMTGKRVTEQASRTGTLAHQGAPVLTLKDFCAEGFFDGVNLSVRMGEILGVAGVIGAGKTELAKAIFGALDKDVRVSGTYLLEGKPVDAETLSPSRATKMGIGFVTEDRQTEGLVPQESVSFNVLLPAFHKVARGLIIVRKVAQALVRGVISDVGLRPPDPTKVVSYLSGGNQQKVVIGKWLASGARLLLLDEPTRGVDVGAREEIYELIRRQAANGVAVVLLSSDLREILAISDRILVMRSGRMVAEVSPAAISERKLLQLVLGGNAT